MLGDPKECREHAKRCWALASETKNPVLQESLTDLAGRPGGQPLKGRGPTSTKSRRNSSIPSSSRVPPIPSSLPSATQHQGSSSGAGTRHHLGRWPASGGAGGRSASLIGRSGQALSDYPPFSVDAARGLVLLFGIGTKALRCQPEWLPDIS